MSILKDQDFGVPEYVGTDEISIRYYSLYGKVYDSENFHSVRLEVEDEIDELQKEYRKQLIKSSIEETEFTSAYSVSRINQLEILYSKLMEKFYEESNY